MARKKNTNTVKDETVETQLDEQVVIENVEEPQLDPDNIINDDAEIKVQNKKMGASTGLLALLLAGIAGVFASPHIAPYMPNSIAQYLTADDGQNETATTDAIAKIDQRITGVESGLEALVAQDIQGEMNKQIADLKSEIESLSKSVSIEGGGADLGSIQAELDALKARNAELSSAIDEKLHATVADAQAQLATAKDAENTAAMTVAITQLRMSAMNGRGIANDLQRLRDAGVDVPSELSNLSSGVDSVATLENEFGDFAIAAIRASVKASSGDQSGFFGDLKSQLSAQFAGRSTSPQEGATPDAILSRSEDHLRNGDLEQSILELSALPSEAMDEMTPWIERAENRLNLIAAIDGLENSSAGN